jgi:signal transduction histidine kinase
MASRGRLNLLEGGDPVEDYAIHGALREARQLIPILIAAAVFLGSLTLEPVRRMLGFGLREGALSVGVFMLGWAAATVAYYRAGAGSRLYRALEFVETLTTTWSFMVLIFVSRSAISFVWFFHLIHVFMIAAGGLSLWNAIGSIVGPSALALAFWFSGDSASALLSFLAGLLGFVVFLALSRVHTDLVESRRREASLRLTLAELRVKEERDRISRDLHDSVATDLTALIWKVRELAQGASAPDVAAELHSFERRLTRTLSDVRDVVTALRASHSSYAEAVRALEERCRELAGKLSFAFERRGELDRSEVEPFCDELFPVACELTKNAAIHAEARSVRVELSVTDEVSLRVIDDGQGLSPSRMEESRGGLHNVRARVRNLAGVLGLTSSEKGTTLTVTLPRPLRARAGREELGANALPPSGTKRIGRLPSHEHGGSSPSRANDERH